MKSATLIGLAKRHFGLIIAISILLPSHEPLFAGQAILSLNSTAENMQGHRIFMRTEGQTYDYHRWVYEGPKSKVTIKNLEIDTVYYFVARAYSGIFESLDSNEVRFVITDSDHDGITDIQEIQVYGTDPHNPDSNGNGMTDGQELAYWADRWHEDGDHDGVINILDADASVGDVQHISEDALFTLRNPAPLSAGKSYLWLEAEDGDVYHPMQIQSGDANSSDNYVQVPASTERFYHWPGSIFGAVVHQFQVQKSGRYLIWGRVLTQAQDGNTVWVSIDGGPYALWVLDRSDQWQWHPVDDFHEAADRVYDLSAGSHTLMIQNNESSPKIDRLLITDDNLFIPNNTGPQGPGAPIKIWFEAEAGDVTYPMQVGYGDAQCSGNYVQVSEGAENIYSWPGSVSGAAIYHFQIPRSGDYVIWGRVLALEKHANGFWISVDGGPYHLWGLDHASQWLWHPVPPPFGVGGIRHYNLSAGSHTLMIRHHEISPKLDQLLITDDPHFSD